MCTTMNKIRGNPLSGGGCPIPVGNNICGETQTLNIINEFKRLYEEKMLEIDNNNCGDCLQDKIKLQQDWIGDLTVQNEMLVRAVEELELEATERVKMLEDKLQRSAECICEVMKKYRENDIAENLLEEPRKRIFNLENDVKNVLEFLRRIRDEQIWDTGGLTFYELTREDLFGTESEEIVSNGSEGLKNNLTQERNKVKAQNRAIENLENKVATTDSLSKELDAKKQECESLQKEMIDVRQALTEEVATKHDTILKLKRECQELEERCIQADKQTAFRDDIIKELRKEIKQLKQQLIVLLENESTNLKSQVNELEEVKSYLLKDKEDLLEKVDAAKSSIGRLECQFNEFLQDREQLKAKYRGAAKQGCSLMEACSKMQEENCALKAESEKLRNGFGTCLNDKNLLEARMKELKESFNKLMGNKDECICQNKQLFEENEKLTKELQNVNEMNKKLLTTIDSLRGQLSVSNRITQGEVTKLNRTIDVLGNTLEQGKMLHDEEQRDTVAEINCLNGKIKDFECCICSLKEEIQEKNCRINCLTNQVKDMKYNLKTCLKEKDSEVLRGKTEISRLNKALKEMENCICNGNQQLQEKNTEIIRLKENSTKLQNCLACLNEQLKNYEDVDVLKSKIKDLECCLNDLQSKSKCCKMCKQNMRVSFRGNTEVQTDTKGSNDEQFELLVNRDELIRYQSSTLETMQKELHNFHEREKDLLARIEVANEEKQSLHNKILILEGQLSQMSRQSDLISRKEDIIKKQKEAINLMQQEALMMKEKEAQLRLENEQCCTCIQQLKNKINELESTVQDTDSRANNLQMAVDFYTNTINVLEASQEQYKLEINHQCTTITNLQDMLVTTKHELEEFKQKYGDSMRYQQNLLSEFNQIISKNELEMKLLKDQIYFISKKYDQLQELNFNVEIEHCSSLQDVEGLDNQLFKYQTLLKKSEDELKRCRSNLRKILKQKKCFEEVILYFREEMGTMSKQLQYLQDLLNMSNASSQEETCRLMQAFVHVQELNQKLSLQLTAAEQKALLENQMNQLHEAKIAELERIVTEKEIDLNKHSGAIQIIRKSLETSLQQNQEFQATISSLNQSIFEFQKIVKTYDEDNNRSKESTALCQSQINCCKDKLEELKKQLDKKTSELCNLETAYSKQHMSLKSCQSELNKFKEKQKAKQNYLKTVIEQLKDQLSASQEERKLVAQELNVVQAQLGIVKTKDSAKEVEIKRYRKLVGDLKGTLVELNKTLSKKEFQFQTKHTDKCDKNGEKSVNQEHTAENNPPEAEICLNCPCEVEFYTNMVNTLKSAVTELKKKHLGSQKKNQELEIELHEKELKVEEISKTQLEKDKEYNELKQKLANVMRHAETEEVRYAELTKKLEKEISSLKQELDVKMKQMSEFERDSEETCDCGCSQLATAQEEVTRLKEQLNKLLKQQRAINIENEKLHNHTDMLQSKVSNLEESSDMLKSQIEQLLLEFQKVQNEKEAVHQKNEDLLCRLRCLQTSYDATSSQQRYKNEVIKDLEAKLEEVTASRDEICYESKNAVNYFRYWLEEQNRINKFVMAKEKDDCKTIDMLKLEIQDSLYNPHNERHYTRSTIPGKAAPPPTCQSPYSLDSQGNESLYGESRSRCPSQCPRLDQDSVWFASNFKNESDSEDNEEDWVTKVQNLTEQVKRTNKMWRQKMEKSEFAVSKDCKK